MPRSRRLHYLLYVEVNSSVNFLENRASLSRKFIVQKKMMDFNSGSKFLGKVWKFSDLSFLRGRLQSCAPNAKMHHAHVPMHVNSSETSWGSNFEACLPLRLPGCVCMANLLLPLQKNNTFQRPALWFQPDSGPRQVSEPGALWFRLKKGQRLDTIFLESGVRPSWYSGVIFRVSHTQRVIIAGSTLFTSDRGLSPKQQKQRNFSRPVSEHLMRKIQHLKKVSSTKSSDAQQSIICSLSTYTYSWRGEWTEGLLSLDQTNKQTKSKTNKQNI